MNGGFRVWLFRFVAALSGAVGLFVFLTCAEITRFYGVNSLAKVTAIGLSVSFLLFTAALIGEWVWKRYAIVTLSVAAVFSLVYFAFRPEMLRDDVLAQLKTPALTVDLVFYRGIALRDDPEKDAKIERMNMIYGFLRSFLPGRAIEAPSRPPIPEAK